MQHTPVHDRHNPDLLAFMPGQLKRVVEVGSSSGALAREYKRLNPHCHYTGVEVDMQYAQLSRRHCDRVVCANIEQVDEPTFSALFPSDCWVFGDSLEHLVDPWALLKRLRARLAAASCVVACIPNAQHWSVQARLNCGMFQYEDAGLLDRTHLRWFTRLTIIELFESAGMRIVEGAPRIFDEPGRETALAAIKAMASSIGADPDQAVSDAMPLQWLVRAVPQ